MAANLLQIVDDIKSSPTVLLDLNNESPFGLAEFDCPPPPLRYTTSSSMLVDGDRISSSSYANRTLDITLDQISASQDSWASSWQTLARLIDQDRFWLKYQPTGATSPVFFNCYRSQVPSMDEIAGATAYRQPALQIPADPAAYGLAEDISSFTITNDPSSGTNRMMVGPSVLGTIKGDLETPLLLAQTATSGSTSTDPFYVSSYAVRGFTHSFLARSLTELTSGTDVGATVSGAGANYIEGNYKSCSFATTTMAQRLGGTFSTALTPMPGLYRVLLRVVIPLTAGTNQANYSFRITLSGNTLLTPTVTKFMQASSGSDTAYTVDLGVVQLHNTADYGAIGLGPPASTVEAPAVGLQASASLVAGAIPAVRFDELFLLPVTTTYGSGQTALVVSPNGASTTYPLIHDGVNDRLRYVYDSGGTTPFSGVPEQGTNDVASFVGGLPTVVPGANNYLQFLYGKLLSTAATNTYVARYYPRYLYLRPAST